ncbi:MULTISPECIES: hypothetical protein [unclassified Streptosporangium]|uniref:hypothetical protein n=1 Tax=unclassified Streptosporangium TaxID=2632669 RepID=UPI002E2DB961|nr:MULTISPECIES: hypothetical protein [unclassified Streptosporangium]
MIHRSPRKARPATAPRGAVGPAARPEAFGAGVDEESKADVAAKPAPPAFETGAGGRG